MCDVAGINVLEVISRWGKRKPAVGCRAQNLSSDYNDEKTTGTHSLYCLPCVPQQQKMLEDVNGSPNAYLA